MSIDVDDEYKPSASASSSNTFKERWLMVNSSNYAEALGTLNDICRTTGFMCYDPLNAVDVNMSLAWAETLQYLDDPVACIKSIECCELIESFVKVVKIATESSYIYLIDLAKLEKVFAELRAVIKSQ